MDKKKNTPGDPQKITGEEKKQKRLFKKRRGGVVLTEDQVQEIKAGRKKLRADMKTAGIKSKKEFELTASSLGLYFDKNRWWALLLWLFHGRALWALLGAGLTALLVFSLLSQVTQMRGMFTINMTDGLFKEGFSLSETPGFENPTSNLYCDPVYDAPCISITSIPDDVDQVDGSHNGDNYFAYTFYVRNEGDNTVGYDYQININSESLDLSRAAWIMLFEDGEMTFYAQPKEDGTAEALPAFEDNTRGYRERPFYDAARFPDEQYETIVSNEQYSYYRAVPFPFVSDKEAVTGSRAEVAPMEVHKYTVVVWLEGDDPDCTDALIGGHIGLEMNFKLISDEEY